MTARRNVALFWIVALVLAAVFVGVQLIRSVEPLGLDQGLFACFGRFVPAGLLPYRDMYDSKPPLMLYTWVLAAQLPGGLPGGVWLFEALWLVATAGLVFLFARRLWGRWSGLAAAALLVFGLWSPGWGGYWARAQAEELLLLPLVGAAWLAHAAGDRPRRALWCGVLTGICGLYKLNALAALLVWPVMWVAGGPRVALLRRTALLLVGALLPWLAALGWFAAHRALPSLWEAVFVHQWHYSRYLARPWLETLSLFGWTLVADLPVHLVLAVAGGVSLVRRRASEARWLLALTGVFALVVVLQRQLAGYHYLILVLPLSLLAAFGLAACAEAVARATAGGLRLAAGIVLLAALGASVPAIRSWVRAYGVDLQRGLGRLPESRYLEQLRRGNFSPGAELEIARYLRQHTRPDDRILVWGLAPGVYALADRMPATRYPFHQLLLTHAPLSRMMPGLALRRARLLAQLSARPPAYVLIGVNDRNGMEPSDSAAELRAFPQLQRIVQARYAMDRRIGDFLLMRRRTM